MKGQDKWRMGDREPGRMKLVQYANGQGDYHSIFEDYDSLEFKEKKAEVKALVQSATPRERAELHFELALYRSLRYAVCSSKYCLALGLTGGNRELHEGIRLMHDMDNS